MKIVETSRCGVSMFFIAVGWTAAASAGQDPLSLPGSCLPGSCRRSPTYGYGRLRLSDAEEGAKKAGFFLWVAEIIVQILLGLEELLFIFAPQNICYESFF